MATCIGIMINDPAGNVWYCYTPLVAYIVDTPELCLMACMSPKAFPFMTATSKHFGDPISHPSHISSYTLDAICKVLEKCSP
ncbi:hypothetical protein J3R82DRAFT_8684 [Butyriboletus roseoflavus]|nr:hypothetical protein J3R82DRAFT_8684 [Butyriboletus roseoflavus]